MFSSTAVKSLDLVKIPLPVTTASIMSTGTTNVVTTTTLRTTTAKIVSTNLKKPIKKPKFVPKLTTAAAKSIKKKVVKAKKQPVSVNTKSSLISKTTTKKKHNLREISSNQTDELILNLNETTVKIELAGGDKLNDTNVLVNLDTTLIDSNWTTPVNQLDSMSSIENTTRIEDLSSLNETQNVSMTIENSLKVNDSESLEDIKNSTLKVDLNELNETMSNSTQETSTHLTPENSSNNQTIDDIIIVSKDNTTFEPEIDSKSIENVSIQNVTDENSIFSVDVDNSTQINEDISDNFLKDEEVEEFEWQEGPFGPVSLHRKEFNFFQDYNL